jgi:hypothetical protein
MVLLRIPRLRQEITSDSDDLMSISSGALTVSSSYTTYIYLGTLLSPCAT